MIRMFTRKFFLALSLALGSTAGALALLAQTSTAQPAPSQNSQQPAAASTTSSTTTTPASQIDPKKVDGGEPHWIRPETPEQRKLRLGVPEDPGPDPDPTKRWWRYGHMYFIEKADK